MCVANTVRGQAIEIRSERVRLRSSLAEDRYLRKKSKVYLDAAKVAGRHAPQAPRQQSAPGTFFYSTHLLYCPLAVSKTCRPGPVSSKRAWTMRAAFTVSVAVIERHRTRRSAEGNHHGLVRSDSAINEMVTSRRDRDEPAAADRLGATSKPKQGADMSECRVVLRLEIAPVIWIAGSFHCRLVSVVDHRQPWNREYESKCLVQCIQASDLRLESRYIVRSEEVDAIAPELGSQPTIVRCFIGVPDGSVERKVEEKVETKFLVRLKFCRVITPDLGSETEFWKLRPQGSQIRSPKSIRNIRHCIQPDRVHLCLFDPPLAVSNQEAGYVAPFLIQVGKFIRKPLVARIEPVNGGWSRNPWVFRRNVIQDLVLNYFDASIVCGPDQLS